MKLAALDEEHLMRGIARHADDLGWKEDVLLQKQGTLDAQQMWLLQPHLPNPTTQTQPDEPAMRCLKVCEQPFDRAWPAVAEERHALDHLRAVPQIRGTGFTGCIDGVWAAAAVALRCANGRW